MKIEPTGSIMPLQKKGEKKRVKKYGEDVVITDHYLNRTDIYMYIYIYRHPCIFFRNCKRFYLNYFSYAIIILHLASRISGPQFC